MENKTVTIKLKEGIPRLRFNDFKIKRDEIKECPVEIFYHISNDVVEIEQPKSKKKSKKKEKKPEEKIDTSDDLILEYIPSGEESYEEVKE